MLNQRRERSRFLSFVGWYYKSTRHSTTSEIDDERNAENKKRPSCHLLNLISKTMKTFLFAALAASAAAFAPQGASKASTSMKGAMEDLKEVAEKSNPVLKVRCRWKIPKTFHDVS